MAGSRVPANRHRCQAILSTDRWGVYLLPPFLRCSRVATSPEGYCSVHLRQGKWLDMQRIAIGDAWEERQYVYMMRRYGDAALQAIWSALEEEVEARKPGKHKQILGRIQRAREWWAEYPTRRKGDAPKTAADAVTPAAARRAVRDEETRRAGTARAKNPPRNVEQRREAGALPRSLALGETRDAVLARTPELDAPVHLPPSATPDLRQATPPPTRRAPGREVTSFGTLSLEDFMPTARTRVEAPAVVEDVTLRPTTAPVDARSKLLGRFAKRKDIADK